MSNSVLRKIENEKRRKKLFANCRSVSEFEKMATVGEGTYGTVFSARDKKTGEIVAIKKLKIHEPDQGFPVTSIREINILNHLKKLNPHPNIVLLKEVVVGAKTDSIFLVFEFCEMDLGHLVDIMYTEKEFFSIPEIKCIIFQTLNAIHYLHQNFIMHRDLKISNLLVNYKGIVKLADYGLSRNYEEKENYTQGVVTLYYRAPEILQGMPYDHKSDIWSLGCIFAELINYGRAILPGKNEEHQFELICANIGFPTPQDWPDFYERKPEDAGKLSSKYKYYKKNRLGDNFGMLSENGQDFLKRMLVWDPKKRMSAAQALLHPYLYEDPLPKRPDQINVLKKFDKYQKIIAKNMEKKRLKKK